MVTLSGFAGEVIDRKLVVVSLDPIIPFLGTTLQIQPLVIAHVVGLLDRRTTTPDSISAQVDARPSSFLIWCDAYRLEQEPEP
jgi:hypothetical protein